MQGLLSKKSVVTIGSCRSVTLLNLGSINESPAETWKEQQDDSKLRSDHCV